MIARAFYRHRKNIVALLDVLQDDDMQFSDVQTIINLIEEHLREFEVGHNKIIVTILQHHQTEWLRDPMELQEVLDTFEYEFEGMDNLYVTAANMLADRKAESQLKPDAGKKRRELALGGGMSLNKDVPGWQAAIGDINSMNEAETALDMELEVKGGLTMPAGEALRAFFVSPDVAEHFRFTYRMRRDVLLDLVNSFLRTPIHEVLLDAFLMVCHDVGDLFKLHMGGRVSVIKEGWELADEMPVAGPPRATRPVKPAGQDDLEQWLVMNKEGYFHPDPTKRTISLDVLGTRVLPYFDKDQFEFENNLYFFVQVGRFYTIPTRQAGDNIVKLRRIDNGWNIYPTTHHFELQFESESTYRQWFKYMNKDYNRAIVAFGVARTNDQVNEKELYRFLKDHLREEFEGNLLGFGRIVPTAHKFHMYLRWCTQKYPAFLSLARDGTVTGAGLRAPNP